MSSEKLGKNILNTLQGYGNKFCCSLKIVHTEFLSFLKNIKYAYQLLGKLECRQPKWEN
jgi:hypothetical protein